MVLLIPVLQLQKWPLSFGNEFKVKLSVALVAESVCGSWVTKASEDCASEKGGGEEKDEEGAEVTQPSTPWKLRASLGASRSWTQ